MIINGLHESLDDLPQVPMITGSSTQQKQKSLAEAPTGSALAFTKVIASSPSISNPTSNNQHFFGLINS